jgi:hypothetical protein
LALGAPPQPEPVELEPIAEPIPEPEGPPAVAVPELEPAAQLGLF